MFAESKVERNNLPRNPNVFFFPNSKAVVVMYRTLAKKYANPELLRGKERERERERTECLVCVCDSFWLELICFFVRCIQSKQSTERERERQSFSSDGQKGRAIMR